MSKRTRGSARAHRRPGTRPASSRSASRRRDTASLAPSPETPSETFDELAATEPRAETAAAPVSPPARPISRTGQPRTRVKPGSLMATRAATEYVYVVQDLKRIAVVGGLLFVVLLALWVLVVLMRVIPLPFY